MQRGKARAARWKPTLSVQFEQKIANAHYIQHLYYLFKNFVGTPPRVRRGGGALDQQSLAFKTYSHPELLIVGMKSSIQLIHTEVVGEKNETAIHELLTAIALAYWFMDNGSRHTRNQNYFFPHNIVISSARAYPLKDQSILVQALEDNFSIHATIQKIKSYYIFDEPFC